MLYWSSLGALASDREVGHDQLVGDLRWDLQRGLPGPVHLYYRGWGVFAQPHIRICVLTHKPMSSTGVPV